MFVSPVSQLAPCAGVLLGERVQRDVGLGDGGGAVAPAILRPQDFDEALAMSFLLRGVGVIFLLEVIVPDDGAEAPGPKPRPLS